MASFSVSQILYEPTIALQTTTVGAVSLGPNLSLGTVSAIWQGCVNVAVGDIVMYDNRDQEIFKYGVDTFFLINQNKIKIRFVILP